MEEVAVCEYARIETIYDVKDLFLSSLLYASFKEDPLTFFTDLFYFNKSHCFHGNARGCVELDVLLPKNCKVKDYVSIGKRFMCEYLPDLPYCFYVFSAGKGKYMRFYISERMYCKDGFVDVKKAKRDVYVNDNGKLCSKKAPGARLVKEKGSITSSVPCDWSIKTHKFMIDSAKFLDLMKEIKNIFSDVLRRFQCGTAKHVKLAKDDRRKARNRYQQRNVSKINQAISFMECKLNELSRVLIAGYFYDYYEKEFHRIRNRYKTIIKNHCMKKGKASLCFTMNTRWDILDQNLESLVDQFNNDLNAIYASFAC